MRSCRMRQPRVARSSEYGHDQVPPRLHLRFERLGRVSGKDQLEKNNSFRVLTYVVQKSERALQLSPQSSRRLASSWDLFIN
jgi:hypothetical protein